MIVVNHRSTMNIVKSPSEILNNKRNLKPAGSVGFIRK
jgi:hypothetical protein